jgi:2',3'-cyclic-nucleotide 2'-phosphodiesterase
VNILFIGDIFAAVGRAIVADHLKDILESNAIDLCIANAENSAGGFGITPNIAEELFALGIDVLTGGNHSFDKREIFDYLPTHPRLLRPANYPPPSPGYGLYSSCTRTGIPYAVFNIQGRTYMPSTDCPFRKIDELLASVAPDVLVRFVDFHAEVTSEKMAMGWHLDGRVSAMIGTHTHIPTADSRILPNGTAYQTDVGMTGPYDSVIGVDKEIILRRFYTALPVRMEAAKGKVEFHSVIIDVDESTGKARSIRRHTISGE